MENVYFVPDLAMSEEMNGQCPLWGGHESYPVRVLCWNSWNHFRVSGVLYSDQQKAIGPLPSG